MQSLRVGVIALLQESNTFVQELATCENFHRDVLVTGKAVREQFTDAHHEVGGFFEGLDIAGLDAVPIFAARAYPAGVIEESAFKLLIASMLYELERAGPLDGLLVAPHGATVSEKFPDADGHWLSLLRGHLGPNKPILGTLDLHANLSPKMVAACDALVAYRTNPHVDQRECGLEAADLIARTLRKEVFPTMAAVMPPLAINIEHGATDAPPCAELMNTADKMLGREGVLSNSIIQGFPYADVPEMSSSTIVVTDCDQPLADDLARELATTMWKMRDQFAGTFLDVETALDRVVSLDGPVCLLDMGDNIGAGSPGDGTRLAAEIHRRGLDDAFVCLHDPASVCAAEASGVGSRLALSVGGKSNPQHGGPIQAMFGVVSLHEGRFKEPQPRHGGYTAFDQGRTAIVRTAAGLTIMLTSRRIVPFSLQQLRSCDLDPHRFRLLVAKGVNAPIAAYREVCCHFLRVNTLGPTCADMTQLTYKHRRRPMFPFEDDTPWVNS